MGAESLGARKASQAGRAVPHPAGLGVDLTRPWATTLWARI